MRGGNFWPAATSIAAEQCASIWAGSILPHCRCAESCKLFMRRIISAASAGWNKVFI